jgi:hypothetical protein
VRERKREKANKAGMWKKRKEKDRKTNFVSNTSRGLLWLQYSISFQIILIYRNNGWEIEKKLKMLFLQFNMVA